MTDDEARQSSRYQAEEFRYVGAVALLKSLAKIEQDAKLGPVHPAQVKIAKICLDCGIRGAREVLLMCALVGVKKRRSFASIVKETPRQHGEETRLLVRRIWDECKKYDTTDSPSVVTEELLESYAESSAKRLKNNLPLASDDTAKSFRSV